MKSVILLLGIFCCAAFLRAQDSAETGHPDAVPPATTNNTDKILAVLTEGSDPFRYGYAANGATGDTGGMLPVDSRSVSVDIRVKGILQMKGKDAAALLQINPKESPVIAKKDDVIFVPQPPRANSRQPRNAKNDDNTLHLFVSEVRDDCVMVAPRKNPDALMMLR